MGKREEFREYKKSSSRIQEEDKYRGEIARGGRKKRFR